jgi:hypothetical protein
MTTERWLMKPSDIQPEAVMEQVGIRASELGHLVRPVQEDLENHIARMKLEDERDFEDVIYDLMNAYHAQGSEGRMFVLGTLGRMLQAMEEDLG